MSRRLCPTVVSLLLWLRPTAPLHAQPASAQVSGRIVDPSGAAVATADIMVVNVATGYERRTVSNDVGYYSVPFLQPGMYRITVIKEGFRPFVRGAMKFNVGENLVFNFALSLGSLDRSGRSAGLRGFSSC